jgi:hypothetical protein
VRRPGIGRYPHAGMDTTRADLHRVAAHVLGRRRYEVSGHFGLRASPGGVATPSFGPEPEAVRLAGKLLVREIGGEAHAVALDGSTMGSLAEFAGANLGNDFSAGADTPPLGALDEVLHFASDELDALYDWFDLGARVLDEVLRGRPVPARRSVVQLWPEHFDVAMEVELRPGNAVTLGFSPGDSFSAEPYAYVGPDTDERPGDALYWNAPFGAAVSRSEAGGTQTCLAFLRRGLDALAES